MVGVDLQPSTKGTMQRLHASKSRIAGPGCCNGWFGDAALVTITAVPRP
jgi:hypothetical protein